MPSSARVWRSHCSDCVSMGPPWPSHSIERCPVNPVSGCHGIFCGGPSNDFSTLRTKRVFSAARDFSLFFQRNTARPKHRYTSSFPPAGPATGSCNGLHRDNNFLAVIGELQMDEKQLILKKWGIPFSYDVLFLDRNDKDYTLIIIGWQSKKEIFLELMQSAKKNFIIFDYPGIGSNSSIPEALHTFADDILLESVVLLLAEYPINKVMGTSAGAAFILKNFEVFENRDLYILSPVLSNSIMDPILKFIFIITLWIQKVFKIELYHKFVNSKPIKGLWLSIVGENSKRQITLDYIKMGMENSHSVWTPTQFFQILKNKKFVVENLDSILDKKDIVFIIGVNDKLSGLEPIKTKLSERAKLRYLYLIDSNHVIELESIAKLTEIIYSPPANGLP